MITQPKQKDYLQDRDEHWKAYLNDNYDMSEYMERDYKSGFSDGYNAAMNNVALRMRDEARKERAALAALQGMLAHGTATCSPEFVAKKAVVFVTALIKNLNNQES